MIEDIKNYKLDNGKTVDEFLKVKHPNGFWRTNNTIIEFVDKVEHLERLYRWKYDGMNFETLGGSSLELTPKLHPNTVKLEENKKKVDPKELEMYNHFWNLLGKEDFTEEQALKETVKFFNKTEEKTDEIILRVSNTLYPFD